MPTRAVTADTFTDTLDTHKIVLVDVWADWCGPCRAFAPVFAAGAERHPDVVFATLDLEAAPDLAARLGIRSVPTVLAFRDAKLVQAVTGGMTAAALDVLVAATRTS